MNARQTLRATLACGLVTLVAACGGGGGGDSTPPAPGTDVVVVTPTSMATFVSGYTGGLAALNTYAGLTSASFLDLFDTAFLDAGTSKTQVASNLSQEAVVVAASPDFPSFPMARLSDASITNCNATTQVCTLTGTLTNADADTTAVTFSTQVKVATDGKVRLLGDQSNG